MSTLDIGFLIFGICALFAYLVAHLPVGECPQCDHCRRVRAEDKRKAEERSHLFAHQNGIPCGDPKCNLNTKSKTDA